MKGSSLHIKLVQSLKANGIARRSWARNEGAVFAAKRAMEANPMLQITIPYLADEGLVQGALNQD